MTWECLECGSANPIANPVCGSQECQYARLAIYANLTQEDRNNTADRGFAIVGGDVARGLDLSSKPRPSTKAKATEHPDFAAFWEVYPRKKDRIVAVRAFTQAVRKGIGPQTMIDGAVRYAKEVADKEPQFRLLPSTFINGRRWEDEADADAVVRVKPSSPVWDMPPVGTPEYDAWVEAEERKAMEL